jgi:2-phospho-L-lactate/phosphoenolpyruvate guanylyltransferase
MFVIIPAKPLNQAKTRLAAVLSPSQRMLLSRQLLQRTIQLAQPLGEVVVVSRDTVLRRLAKQAGAWALVESGNELNQALSQATEWVAARGGSTALILPGDLPLLNQADLTAMIHLGRSTPAMVIAPCQRGDGTNALLLRPPGLIPFAFGPDSFARHLQAAHVMGLEPVIFRSATVALDLDIPEDLASLKDAMKK